MKKLGKIILNILKLLFLAILIIIIFNFFFDRASESQKKITNTDIHKLTKSSGKEVKDNKSSKNDDKLKLPIGSNLASEYIIVENDNNKDHISICAVSNAVGKKQRAQTMINIALEVEKQTPESLYVISLAPHKELCSIGRLIGTTYYSPSGSGWSQIKKGDWKWYILTTNAKVTKRQISDTVLYETNKKKFETEFGSLEYSKKLDVFIEKENGHKAKYVTSGMWVDDYYFE